MLVLLGIKAVGIATSALVVAVVALLCNLHWARKYAPIDHRITVEGEDPGRWRGAACRT